MSENTIYFLIEARYSSTRLPGKVLKKIYKNYLAIDYVIANIVNAGISKKNIIVVTPKSSDNSKIWKYIKNKYSIKIFKGSEQNVFERVYNCCKKYRTKVFARITSDNLFLDPIFLQKACEEFQNNKKIDYLSSLTMDYSPEWNLKSDYNIGSSIEILKFNIMRRVKPLVNNSNCEYPTWLIFSQPNLFKLKKFKLINEYSNFKVKKYRTTLDTALDLKFFRIISKKLNLIPGKNNFLEILKNERFIKLSKININTRMKLAQDVIKKKL